VINVRYPAERKEAILKKMAPPMSMTIPELAEQEGTTATTLYYRATITLAGRRQLF
jgi:hypothetical protein